MILREKRLADFFGVIGVPKKITNFKKYWKNTIHESCTKKGTKRHKSHFFWHSLVSSIFLTFLKFLLNLTFFSSFFSIIYTLFLQTDIFSVVRVKTSSDNIISWFMQNTSQYFSRYIQSLTSRLIPSWVPK